MRTLTDEEGDAIVELAMDDDPNEQTMAARRAALAMVVESIEGGQLLGEPLKGWAVGSLATLIAALESGGDDHLASALEAIGARKRDRGGKPRDSFEALENDACVEYLRLHVGKNNALEAVAAYRDVSVDTVRRSIDDLADDEVPGANEGMDLGRALLDRIRADCNSRPHAYPQKVVEHFHRVKR